MTTSEDEIPLPSQQPVQVDYLQNRQDDFRRGSVKYDSRKQRFVPDSQDFTMDIVSSDMEIVQRETELQLTNTTLSFEKAVEELQKKKSSESEIAQFNLAGVHDWKEVRQVVKSAESSYLKKDSVSGKVRKAFRKVGENAKSIESFVGLLPDGNYKTLCGGLTLILRAMRRHSEIVEKMAELMTELPDVVESCEQYSDIYPGRNELQQRVKDLYIDILAALEYFVKWYMQGTLRHALGSLVKNENYGQAIDLRIRAIRESRAQFQITVDRFLHWRVGRMDELTLSTNKVTLETNETAQNTYRGVERVERSVEDAKKGAAEGIKTLERVLSGLKANITNGTLVVLEEVTKNAKWQSEINKLREERKMYIKQNGELRRRVKETSYTPASLAKALDLDVKVNGNSNDVNDVQSAGLTAASGFQIRAKWIVETSDFRNWIHSDHSDILYVQGNGEQESISSISFMTALLQTRLLESEHVLVLPFYCGLHTGGQFEDSDEMKGPLIMIRALLAQILNLDEIDWVNGAGGYPYLSLDPNQVLKMGKHSFLAHLKVVVNVIAELRGNYNAIFVLLDGLDWYDWTWEREVRQLVERLLRLVRSREGTGVIKIFMSAATRVNCMSEMASEVNSIQVPEEIYDEGESYEELGLD